MVPLSEHTKTRPEGAIVKSPRERLDTLAAYRDLGSYRAAGELCGTTHKTVKRIVLRQRAGPPPPRPPRAHNRERSGRVGQPPVLNKMGN